MRIFVPFLRRHGLQFYDGILFILILVLSFALKGNVRTPSELLSFDSEISLGYSAKQYGDRIYAIDSGHSRLVCIDVTGKGVFELNSPSDNKEATLYIDDIAVTDHGIYMAASEWDGMQIAREVILSLNKDGKYLKTCVENDYSSVFINKHRFYGLCEIEGELIYAECLENSILIHRMDPESLEEKVRPRAYADAYNAVGDIVFDENKNPIVLNKNGEIHCFNSDVQGELIYTTAWPGEESRVPYKIGMSDGSVYFTDIRNREAVRADTAGQKGETCAGETDSQTVFFSSDGKMILTESGGVRIIGDEEVVYCGYHRSGLDIFRQILTLIGMGVFLIVFLLLVIRILAVLIYHKFTPGQKIILVIIASVVIVTGVISGMLLHSFRISYREKIQEQLEGAAYGVARQISVEDMESIRTTADYEGEAYQSVNALMENTLPSEQEFYRQIYCNILRLDEEQDLAYAIAYLDRSIGVYFPLDETETESVKKVYETKDLVWDDQIADVSGTYLALKVPILGQFDEVRGAVSVGVDVSVINEILNAMQMRVLMSVIVIVMLIWVLAEESMSWYLDKEKRKRAVNAEGRKAFPSYMVRILVFLVFAAYNLSSTFLPVYVLRNSGIFTGELKNLAASLPLTVNIFTLGFMSLFCAGLVRRMGMKRIMVIGALFALCGNLLLLLFPTYYTVFLGLLLDGIGEGLIMNAMYVVLTYIKNDEDRRNGFSIYNAACMSGVNFGMLGGSLLAVALGQRLVFLVSVITWASLLILGLQLVKKLEGFLSVGQVSEDEQEEKPAGISSFRFFTDKAVLSFMVLVQNPYIVFNSFVFYLVPVFCSEKGYDETIVSFLIMLYSQVAVLSGDKLTTRFSSLFGNKAMYAALLLNICAVLVFVMTGNITGLIIALLLLGFSAAFGKPVQQQYLLSRDAAVQYGEDRAIGVYNFTENIGESLGPIVFSRLISASRGAYYYFLALVAGCCGLHFVINTKEVNGAKEK